MDDSQPVELVRQVRQAHLHLAELHPLRLEERPGENARSGYAHRSGGATEQALRLPRADALAQASARDLHLAAELLGALAAAVRLRLATPARPSEQGCDGGDSRHCHNNEEEDPAKHRGDSRKRAPAWSLSGL